MVQVVTEAATYSLGFCISYQSSWVQNIAQYQTRLRLTISFPSSEFAHGLKSHLSLLANTNMNNNVTVNNNDVTILLSTEVTKIWTYPNGITLAFSSPGTANAWAGYSKILKRGKYPNNLFIPHAWTHKDLVQAVGFH